MSFGLLYSFHKKYINATFFILVSWISGIYFFRSHNTKNNTKEFQENIIFRVNQSEKIIVNFSNFNPNELDSEGWEKLGFTEKQVKTILKYKNIVGGTFVSKQQLKKCYAISEEKFAELDSYILLPEKQEKLYYNYTTNIKNKRLSISRKFNPDIYSQQDWISLGFSEKQANAILKYKDYLGGSFISKEKFRDCFIISPENYQKLYPYLLLPEKVVEKKEFNNLKYTEKKAKIIYQNFDPNQLDLEGWQKLGFSEKQAHAILNYKTKFLKGSFKSTEDLQKCFVISPEKYEELKQYITISTTPSNQDISVSLLPNENLIKTDFSKSDINTISFRQLKEFGFDDKAAGSLIGFRNKLGGFVDKNQILETYNIDVSLVEKLINTANLNTQNVKKYKLTDAPENWLKSHPYFKYYADKIIFYRITYPDEKKIFKMMKLKPETEKKMKLYLL